MAGYDEISHKGKVLRVGPRETVVEIISKSACAACHASSVCTVADIARKEITVPTDPSSVHREGDEVDVVMHQSMGNKAVWIAYVIPLAVLIVLVMVFLRAGMGELLSGLLAICGVLSYFFIIWLLRGRLSDEAAFYIK
jgi:sigma-E factor negative regulatory protein RseC